MLRFAAGAISALLLIAAGLFFWNSYARSSSPIPPAPLALSASDADTEVPEPPVATPKSKEEKRFARADKNEDGRIELAELFLPRRKAFAKLDSNGDGRLTFEEWAVTTQNKFSTADADRSQWLSAEEYATTRPKVKAKAKRCAC